MGGALKGLSIKRFLPRTLFGRSLLILVTPVVLIQVVTTFVFLDRHWSRVTTHLAFAVAGEISVLTRSLEDGADVGKVQRVIGYAGEYLDLDVRFDRGADLPERSSQSSMQVWESIVAAKLRAELRAMIPNEFVIHTDFSEKQVDVFVQIPQGVVRVNFPQRRLFSSTAYIFLFWMVGTSVLLLLVAVLFMRNQIRPIRKLAVATDRFGKGRDTPFFKPEGAAEVRQAGSAFLDMRRRIERQITQRTDMLAGVSHDLRTPLTRMKLQIEMLPEGVDKEGMRQDVVDMEQMIHGYLDFVRGDGDEEFESVDVVAVFSKLAASLQGHKEVKVHLNVDSVNLPARPMALQRALANVMNNAARFAEEIWVSGYVDGEKFHIQVEDNGPGIPAELYEEVFKPFTRVEGSRNQNTGGIGLGLAITMDIVHAHGGKIFLSESAHGGLSVTLRLPLK